MSDTKSGSQRKQSKLAKALKSFDLFGEGISFNIDGQATHRSYLGAFLSLAIFVVTLSYAVKRFDVMKTYSDTTTQVNTQPKVTDKDGPLDNELTGFDFAFGLQLANDLITPHFVESEGYVELLVVKATYSFVESTGAFEAEFNSLELRRCNQEDGVTRFNMEENDPNAVSLVNLMCIDDATQISVYGIPFSSQIQILSVKLNRCVDKPHCKNETEIDTFLSDKQLMLIYKQQAYDPNEFGASSVSKSTYREFVPFDTRLKTIITTKDLEENNLESEQQFFNPGWFQNDEETFYRVEQGNISYESQDPLTVVGFDIAASSQMKVHGRAIYNALDFLGDVGGLLDALKLIAQVFIGFVGPSGLTQYLIGKLFYERPNVQRGSFDALKRPEDSALFQAETSFQEASHMKKIKLKPGCLDQLSQRWSLDARRQRRLLEKGGSRIDHQLDIVSFIRSQMIVKTLLSAHFSLLERYLSSHNYRTFVLDVSKDTDSSSEDEDCPCSDGYMSQAKKTAKKRMMFENFTPSTSLENLAQGVKKPRKQQLSVPYTDANDSRIVLNPHQATSLKISKKQKVRFEQGNIHLPAPSHQVNRIVQASRFQRENFTLR